MVVRGKIFKAPFIYVGAIEPSNFAALAFTSSSANLLFRPRRVSVTRHFYRFSTLDLSHTQDNCRDPLAEALRFVCGKNVLETRCYNNLVYFRSDLWRLWNQLKF